MNQATIVSIIVPCFNYGHYISDALDSVLSQSFSYWECVVVDDGSTDNSRDVIETYLKKDGRIKYFNQENKGLSAARNAGINKARGEFLQFLDADDLLEARKLETQVQFLRNHPEVDVVYGDCRFFSTENREERLYSMWGDNEPWMPKVSGRGREILSHLLKLNIMVVNAPLVRKTALDVSGLFDESLKANEDWDLWIRCALHDLGFAYLEGPDTRALVRYHAESMSRNLRVQYSSCVQMHRNIRNLLTDKESAKLNDSEIAKYEDKLIELGISSALDNLEVSKKIEYLLQLLKYSFLGLNFHYIVRGFKLLFGSGSAVKQTNTHDS